MVWILADSISYKKIFNFFSEKNRTKSTLNLVALCKQNAKILLNIA